MKLLHLKNKLDCFLFSFFHSVSCLQDFYLATDLDLQIKSHVMFHITLHPLDCRTCHRRITISHLVTQPMRILLHLFHGALTFLIGKPGALTMSTNAILSSLVPLRDFRTSWIVSNSLSSRVSKIAGNSHCPVQVSTRSSPVWS